VQLFNSCTTHCVLLPSLLLAEPSLLLPPPSLLLLLLLLLFPSAGQGSQACEVRQRCHCCVRQVRLNKQTLQLPQAGEEAPGSTVLTSCAK
jgi:hypothetical protein